MNYMTLKNGGRLSAMTLGTGRLGKLAQTEAVQIIKTAKKHGINCIDMLADHAQAFVHAEEAIKGSRSDFFFIVHFGADYSRGDFRSVTEMGDVMNSVTAQMQTLRIDTLDYACLDCPQGMADLESAKAKGILPMMQELKGARVIHEICAYTESAEAAAELLATGLFAFAIVKTELGTVMTEEAGSAFSEIKSPADLVELHSMLKEYQV